jgi:hypothetical protein
VRHPWRNTGTLRTRLSPGLVVAGNQSGSWKRWRQEKLQEHWPSTKGIRRRSRQKLCENSNLEFLRRTVSLGALPEQPAREQDIALARAGEPRSGTDQAGPNFLTASALGPRSRVFSRTSAKGVEIDHSSWSSANGIERTLIVEHSRLRVGACCWGAIARKGTPRLRGLAQLRRVGRIRGALAFSSPMSRARCGPRRFASAVLSFSSA